MKSLGMVSMSSPHPSDHLRTFQRSGRHCSGVVHFSASSSQCPDRIIRSMYLAKPKCFFLERHLIFDDDLTMWLVVYQRFEHISSYTLKTLFSRPSTSLSKMVGILRVRQQEALYHPVVQELFDWIDAAPDRRASFAEAISTATNKGATDMQDIRCLSDWFSFLDSLLLWVPSESIDATEIFNRFCKLCFVLDQPSVILYQSPVTPDSSKEFSFVSEWIIRFNITFGTFMDTPGSLTPESLDTFEANPSFHLSEYLRPRGGWRSFNEFFARQFKPGHRPIAAVEDSSVIVSPVDFTFGQQLKISSSSTVTAKGLTWSISELMVDSPFKDHFHGGTWMHGFIGESDYHRVHAPIGGNVVEARVMSGQHYALIETMDLETETNESKASGKEGNKKTLHKRRVLHAPNEPGYQFVQGRGLIVLETKIGMVAVLPVGMSVVSSVILTAEEGVTLRKGEELGYFQFGGSDVVLMFESKRKVVLDAEPGVHYRMGAQIGNVQELS